MGPDTPLVHKTTYALYELYSPVHKFLDACIISITWASGRGLGPGILEFFGPQMVLTYRLTGPNPLPIALVMDMHASKILCMGLYKS